MNNLRRCEGQLLDGDWSASARVANRVVGAGDAAYYANKGLIHAELASNCGVGTVAFVQGMGGRVQYVGAADVNEAVPARNRSAAGALSLSLVSVGPVLASFGDDLGAAAEILQLGQVWPAQ
jgi:hypothetical protein